MKPPAVVAYIEREGLFLSITRKDTGEHSAPGGKVENGETPITALCREVFEETNLTVTSYLHVHTGFHDSGRKVSGYLVTAIGEPIAKEPGTSIAWVTPETLADGFGGALHRVALCKAGYLENTFQPPSIPVPSEHYHNKPNVGGIFTVETLIGKLT